MSLFGAMTLMACGDAAPAAAPRRLATNVAIPDAPVAGFLAAFMTATDDAGMYYALSMDGRHFESLNHGRPVLRSTLDDRRLRDPMLFRDRAGRYHLVATVSVRHRVVAMWDSFDLVTWTNERLIHTGPAASTKAWAPELAYDAQRDRYVLFYTADQGNWPTTSIYAMTTTDFETFSPPTLLYRDPSSGVMDASIVADAGIYHLFFRGNLGIYHAKATDAMGPYTFSDLVTPELLEGPFAFRDQNSGWTIVADMWQNNSGYTAMDSPDLQTWTRLTNPSPPLYNSAFSFPAGVRHGSVISLSRAQIDTLRSWFDRRAHSRELQ